MRFGMAAFVAALIAAPAAAADIENVRSLDMAVRGTIPQRCAMGAIGNMNFGNLERRGLGAATRVRLECNMPFEMRISAQNGGLAHERLPNGQGPYAGTVPYTIGIDVPVRRPRAALISRTFQSGELRGGRTISSEGGIAVDGMALSVALGQPSGEAGLLAGRYGETIEITITPNL